MDVRRRGEKRGWLAASAGVLAAAALAAPAHARLVFERGWRTSHPSIWIARDDGRHAHRLAAGGSPEISPDGRRVAYIRMGRDGRQELLLVSVHGGRVRLLLHGFLLPVGWSPDGKRIAGVQQGRGTRTRPGTMTIVTIDVASGRIHRIEPASLPFETSFSPHGSQIAYTRTRPGSLPRTNLFRQPAAGGRALQLTYDGRNMWPVWGRSWIAFVHVSAPSPRDRIAKQEISLVKPDGTRRHRLTHVPIGDQMFGFTPIAWSANGRRLIAEFNGMRTDYVVTVDPRTGAVRRVGKPTGGEAGMGVNGAALSRDGRMILGVRDLFGTPAVVTLPYTGGRPRVLARNAISPSWSR